ncbi:MAG TPA: 4-(cytidine 5'-diphospho)-2-C-methyl-D-erythritol kinase [Tepidisphaeraceae bacterium]|nr:4-(cytidine 5'-diphospho)-2-C-methyl-D-erythritol kinase [Tepidisphaeraceae bacterium]
MRQSCPAKINLHLRIAPADGSGFHPLLSWMCTIGLFDTLTIQRSTSGQIVFQCDDPSLPGDSTNLAVRAALAIQREMGEPKPGVELRLEKRIPIGGGLGGGSSDAAHVLLTLNQLWDLHWPIERLAGIAARLGSDVPFFVHGSSSVCTGRGEIVRPTLRPRPRWVVLILPGFATSTPAVYRKFDELRLGDRSSIENEPSWQQWAELSAGPLLSRLINDLETPAFALCPQLATLRANIEQLLGRVVRMSGSGSSLFTLYDSPAEARSAVDKIVDRCSVRVVAVESAPNWE